ncbi:MAG: shikimate dehydrogenase [Rubrobacteraceae bacterium]
MLSGRAQVLGVIGYPIGHSLSPRMHNAAFAASGLDYVYVPLEVRPERLPAAIEGTAALGFRGFNVTMPHKESILPLLDEVEETARIAGAVNTVVVKEGCLRGLNTDGSGFVEACRVAAVDLAGRRVLILGAGGAAAAIACALIGERVAEIKILNRNASRAERLRDRLASLGSGVEISAGSLDGMAENVSNADIIVNATYLGMKDEDELPFPAGCIEGGKVVCDAVYRAGLETKLIQLAREAGALVVPGDRMLLYQGVQAQRLWTGREPDVEAMNDALA